MALISASKVTRVHSGLGLRLPMLLRYSCTEGTVDETQKKSGSAPQPLACLGRLLSTYWLTSVPYCSEALSFGFQPVLITYFSSAVGNAYAVLSNSEKRARYDKYGLEDDSPSSSHRGHSHRYNRYYHDDEGRLCLIIITN